MALDTGETVSILVVTMSPPDTVRFENRARVGTQRPYSVHVRKRGDLWYACALYNGGHIVFGWYRERMDACTDFVRWVLE